VCNSLCEVAAVFTLGLMDEPVFFGPAFEGLYVSGLGAWRTPAVTAALGRLGVDLSRPLLPAYPPEVWFGALRVTAPLVFPDGDLEQSIEALGRTFLKGFQTTLLGKAAVQVGKLLGLQRALMRMGQNSRTTSNLYDTTAQLWGLATSSSKRSCSLVLSAALLQCSRQMLRLFEVRFAR
jgi:uncharacterized protein (TIGR02265 family)